MPYSPAATRYDDGSFYRRCGRSGLMLPAISLGCWHNFGAPGSDSGRHGDEASMHENAKRMLFTAFDHGITHFDLANNYGPPPGSAETRVGRILHEDLRAYRDELIISSKAGYRMWPGPYGEWGSRKNLLASLDQSLGRLRLEYVDIFYSHRPDPDTPWEETMFALDSAVRQGKALYAGISSYSAEQTTAVSAICERNNFVKPIIHQPHYSMFKRWVEDGLLAACTADGLGTIAFCPLEQGLLTGKYLKGIPEDSRAKSVSEFLTPEKVTPERVNKARKLNELAKQRGQSLAQMALVWVLRPQKDGQVTTALIGASRPEQISENVAALKHAEFSGDELQKIDAILR